MLDDPARGSGGQSWIRTRTRAAYHCAGCVCCHQLAKVSNSTVPICLHGNSVGSLRSRCLLHTANIPEQVPVSVDGWYSPKQLILTFLSALRFRPRAYLGRQIESAPESPVARSHAE